MNEAAATTASTSRLHKYGSHPVVCNPLSSKAKIYKLSIHYKPEYKYSKWSSAARFHAEVGAPWDFPSPIKV